MSSGLLSLWNVQNVFKHGVAENALVAIAGVVDVVRGYMRHDVFPRVYGTALLLCIQSVAPQRWVEGYAFARSFPVRGFADQLVSVPLQRINVDIARFERPKRRLPV